MGEDGTGELPWEKNGAVVNDDDAAEAAAAVPRADARAPRPSRRLARSAIGFFFFFFFDGLPVVRGEFRKNSGSTDAAPQAALALDDAARVFRPCRLRAPS